MKKIHKYVILASVSILTICLFIGIQDSNVDTKFTMPIENDDLHLYTSEGDEIIPEDDPPDEGDPISIELIDTEIIFDTNTSAEDQSKISWGYSEWRAYIIFQGYNVTEAEIDDSILNNETVQFNLHISTIIAWGQYNGSLNEEELLNLYNQMEHHTVTFDSAGYYESSDERLYMRIKISVRSIAWLLQWHEARSLDIQFCSTESSKWGFVFLGIKFYEQVKHHQLGWTDSNRLDIKFTQRSVYSDIPTGSLENNLYIRFKVNCIYNSISYTIYKYYRTHLVDDDTQGPIILPYYIGSYTDGNPGKVFAIGYDKSGGEWTSPTEYFVANSLITHSYTFSAVDHDNDRDGDASSSSKTIKIPIHDDDTTPPVIGISYSGSKTDKDPGKWSVSVSDPNSGVAQISVMIDGTLRGTTAGDYTVSDAVGSHTISVYAINNDRDRFINGVCIDQEADTKTNTVTIAYTPPTDPVVAAGPDQTINEGDTASFFGDFEDTGEGEIHEYQWDFGDGTVLNFPGTLTPTHKYIDDGAYTVTLTVIDDDGGVGSDTLIVTVYNVAPTVNLESDQTIDEGSTASFSGSSTDPGEDDIAEYQWDFGDGTIIYPAGTLTPTHTYLDNGTYTVTLTVFDGDGGIGSDSVVVTVNNVAPTADAGPDQMIDEGFETTFSGTFTDPGEYDTHKYHWDFGDGSFIDLPGTLTPTHAYGDNGAYTVTLTVFDNSGDFDTDTLVVTVNNVAPTVDAEPDQTIDEGFAFTFSGSFTDLGVDDTYTYDWDFGDGTVIYDAGTLTPTHAYGDNEVYTVTLTVTDDDGGVGSNSSVFTVNNVAPTADAGADQTIDEGFETTFSGTFTDPGEYDTHKYHWDFGDGTFIDLPGTLTPIHTYIDDGVYTVTLTVFDDDGASSSDTLTVTVNNVAPTVNAGSDFTVEEDHPFTLSGSFTDPGWLDTHTILWIFWNVDGTDILAISNELNPRFTYYIPGEYIVTFTVWDDDEDFDSDTVTITALDKTPPVTSIAYEPYYQDEFGNIYITSDTLFTLNVLEEFSGVDWTKYTINGEEFDYTTPFNIVGPDGTYVITYNSADTSGNVEKINEDNEITVILVSLDVNSYLTDSDFNPVSYFDFIFRKDKLSGFTLVATNPGQFYYHIEVLNTWLTTIDTLTIEANLPLQFITQGATPIHVYLDGVDITNLCVIDGTTVIVSNVPSGSLVYITIHMDFSLKGESFGSLDDFILGTYSFEAIISGEGILIGTYGSSSFLIGHQKKSTGICGFVTDIDENPIPGVIISLYSENGFVTTATTDENGFYYFIELDLPTYYLQIGPEEDPIIVMPVTVKKDDFVEVNFSY